MQLNEKKCSSLTMQPATKISLCSSCMNNDSHDCLEGQLTYDETLITVKCKCRIGLKRLSFLAEFKWLNSNKYTSVSVSLCAQRALREDSKVVTFHIIVFTVQTGVSERKAKACEEKFKKTCSDKRTSLLVSRRQQSCRLTPKRSNST